MKVLTLHQPYATLIALGVKTIETRPQPFRSLVGQRIAIHAAARKPVFTEAPVEAWLAIDKAMRAANEGCAQCGHDEGAHVCCFDHTECVFCRCDSYRRPDLPLGAIVCTAVVTDSLPMVDAYSCPGPPATGHPRHICIDEHAASDGRLLHVTHLHEIARNIGSELPYGDFRPGRFGLLLADVEPVEPFPFKGGQGLSRSVDPGLLRMARRVGEFR